ncbi:MAG: LysM peptidoglycan-binding domain-containing protein [Bacteroidales bacterium]|jgi:LysM repeat protein|nr:LysM peptidoglycan-binding domain-containing protein [Bacteroidales bacterium]
MIKIIRICFLLTLLLAPHILLSQTASPTIVKSSETDTIGGKVYYKHTIEKNQTLYSISKVYQVSIEELQQINPELAQGLKTGNILYIPKMKKESSSLKPLYIEEKKDSVVDTFTPSQEKSTNIQYSDDYAFYVHSVSRGQTLYFLSRLYEVPTTELYASNPGVSENLSIGQLIKIPCADCPPPKKNEKPDFSSKKPKKGVEHTIDSAQTIYDIAVMYNVPPEVIYMYNPFLTDTTDTVLRGKKIEVPVHKTFKREKFVYYEVPRNAQISMISQKFRIADEELLAHNPRAAKELEHKSFLKIPIIQHNRDIAMELHKEQEEYVFYTVQPKETVYSITKKYDVSEKTLYNLNPSVSKRELSIGTVLKIPAPKNTETYIYSDTITRVKSQKNLISLLLSECFDSTRAPQSTFNIAVLLPFYLQTNNSLDSETDIINKHKEIFAPTIPFIEYYEGLLIGVDSLKNKGISVNLYVFDVHKDTLQIPKVLRQLESKQLDLIIGPVFPEVFASVSVFAERHNIPIISPLAAVDNSVDDKPFAIQVNPPERLRHKKVAKTVLQNKPVNVILVYNSVVLEENMVNHCHHSFTEQIIDSLEADSVTITEILFPEHKMKGLEQAMKKDVQNVVIVISRNQAFITNVVTQLYWQIRKYPIDLYSFASWERFENIELDFLFELNFKYTASGYPDYTSDSVSSFIHKYRTLYKTEPSRFSFQGYDQILYFVEALQLFGENMIHCLPAYQKEGLYSGFSFIKEHEYGGLMNNSIHIIEYSGADNKVHTVK